MMTCFWIYELVIFVLLASIVVKVSFDTKKEQEDRYRNLLKVVRFNVLEEERKLPPTKRSLCTGCALKSWYFEGVDGLVPKLIQPPQVKLARSKIPTLRRGM